MPRRIRSMVESHAGHRGQKVSAVHAENTSLHEMRPKPKVMRPVAVKPKKART